MRLLVLRLVGLLVLLLVLVRQLLLHERLHGWCLSSHQLGQQE